MGEFWAAIIGAVVGALAGGGVSALLQQWQYRREKADRDRATAQSLFFKVLRIHSDLEGYRRHIVECAENARRDGLRDSWQSLRPLGNGPGKIAFAAEEMALLLSLKKLDLFNIVLSLDAVHGSTIDIFALYAARRVALTSQLAPDKMEGIIGDAGLTEEDIRRLAPLDAELNDLVEQIRARADRDAEEAWTAVQGVNDALRPILGYRLELEPVASAAPIATIATGQA